MEIKPYEKNAKEHPKDQVELIARSIQRFGWRQPIVVNQEGIIVVGHGRWEAWNQYKDELNLKEAWIIDDEGKPLRGEAETTALTPDEERSYRLADNQINALSGNNMILVKEELKLLDDELLELTGFDRDLIIDSDERDDKIPEAPDVPKTKIGDIYELGKHRIICGDSTKPEDVEKLMGGRKADMVFTSPPYNIGKGVMYETYEDNLSDDDYENFLLKVLMLANLNTKGIIFWNVSYNKNNKKKYLKILSNLIEKLDLNFRELITWDKGWAMPISQSDSLTRQTEQILTIDNNNEIEYILVADNTRKPFIKKNMRKLSNYWVTKPGQRNLENHGACYPVELVTKAIVIATKEGEIIYEPFAGSGTNVIAAQKTGRICYGVEIDPIYVDVIVQRYVEYTGNKEIIKNGEKILWE